jgi:hypothetical protein
VQGSRSLASLSCGQLLVLRKLALLKLTACMERYCPTHRTGWNWELPKFIRKIKTPDYKGELLICKMHRCVLYILQCPLTVTVLTPILILDIMYLYFYFKKIDYITHHHVW